MWIQHHKNILQRHSLPVSKTPVCLPVFLSVDPCLHSVLHVLGLHFASDLVWRVRGFRLFQNLSRRWSTQREGSIIHKAMREFGCILT